MSLTVRLIEQRLKVSGSAISNCEDHSFTKIYFKLKKNKAMSQILVVILPQAGNPLLVRIFSSKLFLSG